MDFNRLYGILDSYKDDMISTLIKWISVPSVNAPKTADNAPFGDDVRRMLDMAYEDATEMGFETKELDGYAMHAQLGSGESTMGILCHLDVVPAGDGWKHDPYTGVVEDGKIYGRGTADDKGCAVVSLYAMKAVREAGIKLRDGVRLILGCDEETGSTDMHYYAEHLKMPDYGFSPDAEFPVINTEKGGMHIELTAEGDGAADTAIPVYSMYAGERANIVPGMAYAIIGIKDKPAFDAQLSEIAAETGFELSVSEESEGKYRLTAIGKQSHASLPDLGLNAAGELLIALKKLGAGEKIAGAIGTLADVLGIETHGEALGIFCEDEASGKLTCNIGLLRYDGNQLSVTLDCRTPVCADVNALCESAKKVLEGTDVSFTLASSRPYHHVPAEHKVVKGLIKAYSEVTGQEGYAFAIGGGTYSRYMPNTVAFGPNFPGDIDMCHMPDEFVEIDKMMLTARIIARAIVELAGAEE